MLFAKLDAINRELAAHRFELKTLLQSEPNSDRRFIQFDVPEINIRGSLYNYTGNLYLTNSEFHLFRTGSMYKVTGDVSDFFRNITPGNQIQCIYVQDLGEHASTYCMCHVTLKLNDAVIIIERLDVPK